MAEFGERERIGGMPLWLVVVVLGASGVAAYLLFFRKQTPTDGATTFSSQGLAVMQNPDESATMALQNQELSLIAQSMSQGFSNVGTQLTDIGSNVTNGFATTGSSLNTISGQIATNGTANEQYYQSLLSNLQSSTSANQAYYNSLLANIVNYANAISSQVSGVTQQQALDQAAQAAGFANIGAAMQAQDRQLGTIQDWTNEIKARLQQGDYSAAQWGPSGQSWQTASSLPIGR